MHIVILSGMNAKNTNECLKKNNINVQITPNQIHRVTKITDKRITYWIALNTRLTQQLLPLIHYQLKHVVFLYDISQPITLLRAHGWWKLMNSERMVLWSMPGAAPTPAYDKMIESIADKFKLYDNSHVPHYTCKLKDIINFLNAYSLPYRYPNVYACTCTMDS